MIHRVYEQAVAAQLGKVVIACDGAEIAAEARKIGAQYIITDPALPSGTDRIYSAYQQLKEEYDIIVNLQGDLPTIDPQVIKAAAQAAQHEACDLATVASIIKDQKDITNPNIVKIAIAFKNHNLGSALYFSRSPIPYVMNQTNNNNYYHHIGIYAYKAAALKKFVALPTSALEKRESLEQLRALENDMKILVQIVDTHPMSVDTKEDLQAVIASLK